jgi:peroxiredoxin
VRPLLLLVALGGALAAGGAGPAAAGAAPAAAPELTLADGINGVTAQTRLAALRGKAVVVAFWVPICPHCRGVASRLDRIRRTYGAADVQVLAVSHGKKPYVDAWLKEQGLSFGVGFDWTGRTAARYGVRALPGMFLVGKDGTLRASGADAGDAALRAELGR